MPYFEIDQLAINYNGEFFDSKQWPIQVSPAKLLNSADPYGNQMFVNALMSGKYDYVWIMNDSFVVHKTGKELPKILESMGTNRKKVPTIIYYCPIDCNLQSDATGMLKIADHIVAYCNFGSEQILKTMPEVKGKISTITHGVDPAAFHKVDSNERRLLRSQLLKVTDDNTFVWMNVNRNSVRKDIARTILAFSEFRKQVPNSKLYLHTMPRDTTIDLLVAVKELGLSIKDDVLFPGNYSPAKPYPAEILNSFYNCADGFITTSLGEGWGLTHLDAALVGLPIVAPNNTCFPEQLDNGRGFLYPCYEKYWIDNSGYRPIGRLDDIVVSMKQCYVAVKDNNTSINGIRNAAKQYVDTLSWDKIGTQWVDLFKQLQGKKNRQVGIKQPITGIKL